MSLLCYYHFGSDPGFGMCHCNPYCQQGWEEAPTLHILDHLFFDHVWIRNYNLLCATGSNSFTWISPEMALPSISHCLCTRVYTRSRPCTLDSCWRVKTRYNFFNTHLSYPLNFIFALFIATSRGDRPGIITF